MAELKNFIRIFLAGDVMTGRGIDQILAHPCPPVLYEPYVKDAREYVYLAEEFNGKINYPVANNYIWGDALKIWEQQKPDVKIVNLETSITQSETYWLGKGINYRMHPANIDVLTSAEIDICTLANNHILDWDYAGLDETCQVLKKSSILFSGVGENISEAIIPAILPINARQRVLVFATATLCSGVPAIWSATNIVPGVNYLAAMNKESVRTIAKQIQQYKQAGDLIVFSIHVGSNWGYDISLQLQQFARHLIDEAGIDVFFGHSSHHPRPLEIYHEKPIFYGCGDFINDYEGIRSFEEFRADLVLMYFLDFDRSTLMLKQMRLVPLQTKQFSLHMPNEKDCQWLLNRLNQFANLSSPLILKNDLGFTYYSYQPSTL